MRPTRPKFALAAMLGLALAAVLLPASAVRAAEDEEEKPSWDKRMIDSIMQGIGFQRDGMAGISYQERPPLVLPPKGDLPVPEKRDAAADNPAWPKDPDVKRRKEQAKLERNRNVSDEREREQNPLRPDQMTPGGTPSRTASRRDDGYQPSPYGYGSQLPPSELGSNISFFGLFKSKESEEIGRFTGEPPRSSLTEPPRGYQTPSPNYPYGLTKGTTAAKPADAYTTRGEIGGTR